MNALEYYPPPPRFTWDFTWLVIAACVCLGVFLIGAAMMTLRSIQAQPPPTTAPASLSAASRPPP